MYEFVSLTQKMDKTPHKISQVLMQTIHGVSPLPTIKNTIGRIEYQRKKTYNMGSGKPRSK